jgi:hypothetical protein
MYNIKIKSKLVTNTILNWTYYNDNKRLKYRIHNLAHIGNLMIELVYKKYSNYDFFIMMDFDDVCHQPTNLKIL